MKVLVLNAGSSSLKYQLFEMPSSKVLKKGSIAQIGEAGSAVQSHKEAIDSIFKALVDQKDGIISDLSEIEAVGHRVVHGGETFQAPVMITEAVKDKIRECIKLAPLHNPPNLSGIEAVTDLLPEVPQIAVFDTAFHQTIPKQAFLYALPYSLYEKHKIRKYGFHGISHDFVAIKAAEKLGKDLQDLKIITCHLGNGCSVAAIKNGKSVDTSMGFTPLEGLVMGTRSGDLDPAIVSFIMEQENISPENIDTLLNKESGLLGLSGLTNDVRTLIEATEDGNEQAALALDVFAYRVKKYIGAYAFAMGGVDAIVFTGGIGEHESFMRDKILDGVFGVLDAGKTQVMVIPTNEELMIAEKSFGLVEA